MDPCETGCPPEVINNSKHHTCWNCNTHKQRKNCAPNLFCDGCGVMLPIPRGTNFFELLGEEEETFTIDVKALDARYKKMMSQMHPDKFMQKSPTEQQLSAVSLHLQSTMRTQKHTLGFLLAKPIWTESCRFALKALYCA